MKNRLILLTLALLLASGMALAQPGGDPSRFDASDTCTCYYDSIERSVVFIGRVLSVEEIENVSGPAPRALKLVVKAETLLKGEVNPEQEIYVAKGYLYSEDHIQGNTFLFMANDVSNELFTGLFADRWSFAINGAGNEEWDRRLTELQSIFGGVAQRRIIGAVMEWPWNGTIPHPLLKPSHPLAGITVVAEDTNGRQFTAQTDEAGRFVFENLPLPRNPPATHRNFITETARDQLPAGTYVFSLLLPKKMDVYYGYPTSTGVLLDNEKRASIQLGTALCSATLQFLVRESGTVNGQIVREGGIGQLSESQLRLYRYDPERKRIVSRYGYDDFVPTRLTFSGTGANRIASFSFEHIPVGPYLLEISNFDLDGTAHSFYHPQTKWPEEATIINVTADKPTKIQVRLPWVLPN